MFLIVSQHFVFPLECLQTIFSAADLSCLSFSRDISPDTLNFELLMQREIDEKRIHLEPLKAGQKGREGAQ